MPITITQFFAATGQPLQTGLAKIVERYSKVAPVLALKKIDNLAHKYGKEASLGGVTTRTINTGFGDVEQSSVTPAEESIIIAGRPVVTDYRLEQINPSARAGETARAMRAIARWMDDQIVNGVTVVDRTGDDKPLVSGLNGFKSRCLGGQLFSAGANGGDLMLWQFEQALDATVDQGNGIHVFMNKPNYRRLKDLVLSEAGGAAVADVTGDVPTYEGAHLHVIGDKLDGTSVLDFNETQGTSNVTSSIYFVAPGNEDVELSGVKLLMASNSIEIINEGIRNSMMIDQLECAFGLAVYDDTALTRLKGITRNSFT